jgi:hypothetical protein
VHKIDDTPRENAFVLCHGCGSPIHVNDQAAYLDSIRHFVRLRCVNPSCGRVDWFEEVDFVTESTAEATAAPEGAGEVWVHDLLLGLSFRDPNGRA